MVLPPPPKQPWQQSAHVKDRLLLEDERPDLQLSMIGARAVLAVSTKIGFYKVVLSIRVLKARPPCANLNKMLQMLRVYAYWTPDPLAPTLKLAHGGRLK